jgi:hypothetical protein
MNLTCPAAGGTGGAYHHHSEMNIVVHWQTQAHIRTLNPKT